MRKKKRKNRFRGKRTHGRGDTKRARGAGTRGGRGKAGGHKHKYNIMFMCFGKKGFKSKKKRVERIVNLGELEKISPQLIEKKLACKKGDFLELTSESKITKIAGRGKINLKLHLSGIKVSENARTKILEAGGKIE